MEETEYKIWFSKIEISNKNKLKLLKDYGNIASVWKLNKNDLISMGYLRKNN